MKSRIKPHLASPAAAKRGAETSGAVLCLNMIVRNEAEIIERCLASVADHIACWVIGDTGSTDGTQQIVESFFKKRGIPGELHSFPFENFEQARNEALSRAEASPLEFDYVLFCDADMELVVDETGFRRGLRAPGYLLEQLAGISYWNVRLVRRGAGAKYVGVTHEYVQIEGDVPRLGGAWYRDHASGSSRGDKSERDIRLLTEALESEPDNARYWFYLAQTYREAGRLEDAVETYRKRADMGGFAEEAWYARMQQARCLRGLGLHDAFVATALAAYNERPHRAEPLYDLARFYRERGMNETAVLFAETGLALPRPEGDVLFIEDHVYKAGLREEYSIAGFYMRDAARKERGFAACNWLALNRAAPAGSRALARSNLSFYLQPAAAILPSLTARRIDFSSPEGYVAMNPAVARIGDRLMMVQRTVNFTVVDGRYETPDNVPVNTRNFLVELDDQLQIKSSVEILPPAHMPKAEFGLVLGFEDMRLFAWRGQLWCTATVRELTPQGWCEQVLARIESGDGACRLTDWRPMHPPGEKRNEKNWMPQVCGDDLRFVYLCDPTRIVDEYGQPLTETTPAIAADQFRGGSATVPFDGGWLTLIHEVQIRNGLRHYQHRFVLFDANNVLCRVSRPFFLRERGIEFAIGLAEHPDSRRLVFSYGIGDRESWIATVDMSDVRRSLENVADLPSGLPRPAAAVAAAPRSPAQPRSAPKQRTIIAPRAAIRARVEAHPPIFIHSGPRTASTWFWGRFRPFDSTCCYREPYHRQLHTITRAQARSRDPSSWDSRHPAMDPYNLEYLPLIRPTSGGVRLFGAEFPFKYFIPQGGMRGELRLDEKRYLALLVRHAAKLGKTPVLGFTESVGRIWSVKQTFGGLNIMLYRNLWHQWMSFIAYKRKGMTGFYRCVAHFIDTREDAYLSGVADAYAARVDRRGPRVWKLEGLSEADTFGLFMALHVYLYLHGEMAADTVVDVTRMARDDRYRVTVEQDLQARSSLALSFADVREERPPSAATFDVGTIDWAAIRQHSADAVSAVGGYGDRETLARRAAEIVDETFHETASYGRSEAAD